LHKHSLSSIGGSKPEIARRICGYPPIEEDVKYEPVVSSDLTARIVQLRERTQAQLVQVAKKLKIKSGAFI
jgi:hypothetical protein